MSRHGEMVTPLLYHDRPLDKRRGSWDYWLKLSSCDELIRYPEKEIEGYHKLSPYLKMSHAHLASTDQGFILVVRGVDAQAANKIFLTDPHRAVSSLNFFLDDLDLMWENTKNQMDESQVSRNWRGETNQMIDRLLNDTRLRQFAEKPLLINGQYYPSVGETLNKCRERLNCPDPVMVLCHGDEHLGNLLVTDGKYLILDPGNYTGFNSPASAVNNMVGGSYLFDYRYCGEVCINGQELVINYQIDPDFQIAESILRPSMNRIYKTSKEVSGGLNSAKELLFVNELRVAMGWTKRDMDLTPILATGLVFIGPATEHYYSSEIV